MITVRLGLQQRVLPIYRVPFFTALAAACPQGLGLFAGQPRPVEMVENRLEVPGATVTAAQNIHILRGSLYACWQSGLLQWLNTFDPQALIMEANPRYLHSPAAVRWMQRRKRPVIGWGLGAPDVEGAFSGLRAALWSNFLTRFDALITYSQQGKAQYMAAGIPAGRIFIARNAAVARPTQPAPQRVPAFGTHGAVVLYVGRLQARKRIDLLIQTCASLPEPRPQLWIVGDGPVRAELEAQAASIYPTTRFFGALYGQALDDTFQQADLFVLPGTGGLAVQQAMGHALPVIVAEGDGTQSDLVRPENGWQVIPGSLLSLTSAVQQALQDVTRLRQMGMASYRIVAEEINLDTMLAAFEEAVRSAI